MTKDILEALDGRPKAYFYAISMHGNLQVYCEIKPLNPW